MSDIDIDITEEALEFDVTATGPKGNDGNDGADGDSSYTYVAYASDNQGTDFSLTPASNLTYVAILSTNTEIDTPEADDFAGLWQEYKSDIQSINDLNDVSADSPSNKQILEYDGENYVNVLNPVFKDVKNNTATPRSAGTIVSVVDDAGANPLVDIADKDTNSDVAGILIADMPANGDGIIQLTGTIQESFIDTSGITAGATIYLGSNGAYTDVKPTTGHIIRIGKAGVSNPSNGSLLLDMPSSSTAFADLNDTTITDGTENDLLTLESGVWVNKTRADLGQDKSLYNKSPQFTPNLQSWDNFQRSDRDLDGDISDSGHTYTLLEGAAEIISGEAWVNGLLQIDNDVNEYIFTHIFAGFDIWFNGDSSTSGGVALIKDPDNYLYFYLSGGRPVVVKVIAGIKTETALSGIGSSQPYTSHHIQGSFRRTTADSDSVFLFFTDLTTGNQIRHDFNETVFTPPLKMGLYSFATRDEILSYKLMHK